MIGEAAHNIELNHPDFSHGYFPVDPEVVWQTITRSLPALKETIAEIREQTP
ncbi:DUF86 domain-containing protein [Paraburkholderia phymatum]|uniref:DUF86 domain-containing protein n=1 Tax=Paraburkholderia phymatum TaxID=148447 RepID=A0ACC6TUJ5_9BURK